MGEKRVFIDAGHGGSDSGALSASGICEKDRNLVFALALGKKLTSCGINVAYSRTEDVKNSLQIVCLTENDFSADCTISCHMDAAASSASGVSALIHSRAGEEIANWAKNTISLINKVGITSNRASPLVRGYMQNPNADYYFNAHTKSPSMILELGFITNADNLKEHTEKCEDYAEAVCRAICDFLSVDCGAEKSITLLKLSEMLRDEGIGEITLN